MKLKLHLESIEIKYHPKEKDEDPYYGLKKITKVAPNVNIMGRQLTLFRINKGISIEDKIKVNDMIVIDRFPLSGNQTARIESIHNIENKNSIHYKYGLRKYFTIQYYKDKKSITTNIVASTIKSIF